MAKIVMATVKLTVVVETAGEVVLVEEGPVEETPVEEGQVRVQLPNPRCESKPVPRSKPVRIYAWTWRPLTYLRHSSGLCW